MPHLFDVAYHMDPSAFQTDGRSLFGNSLASTIRARGERETDVRLLVDNGERYLTLANDLANTLHCDVYLTPHGAQALPRH